MMASESEVELGFVEDDTPSWKLTSKHFPSKVGGRPAWLNLKDLPSPSSLACDVCKKPCLFLLQIYAPVENEATCFHRTLFIFLCKEPACCKRNDNRNFKIFRCQLPRANDSYGFDPYAEDDDNDHPSSGDFNPMCRVCGCKGPLRCSKCHEATYCSSVHQTVDWKSGHKASCKSFGDEKAPSNTSYLLKEFEIVMEMEPVAEKKSELKSEQERMDDFRQFVESEKGKNMLQESDDDVEKEIGTLAQKEDKQYHAFTKRIQMEPEQILRYHRGQEPLWVSEENKPHDGDIPPCNCGAKRIFEFQILPQLLNHLQLDSLGESIDWGTLAVYTCSDNCDEGSAYHSEFLWKQDFAYNDPGIEVQ